MYRIHQIKLNIDEPWENIPDEIRKNLKMESLEISDFKVVKESIDARDKGDLKYVYSVDFECDKKLDLPAAKNDKYEFVPCVLPKDERPIVVGFGPAGMFSALTLAQMGYNPIVLERGKSVDERTMDVAEFWKTGKLNTESNVQFGEGGAGTFSDGKLTTGKKDIRIRKILEEFVRFGASEEILYKQKPHIGTDVLKVVVKNLREEIINLGGEVNFSSKVTDVLIENEKINGVVVNGSKEYISSHIVLAMGHSARDTFEMLYERKLKMEQKPFSIGMRIEHPQKMINEAQYGSSMEAKKLPPADYKLSCKTKNGRGVYTFCMCPGGEVINASSEKGYLCVNGMSNSSRNSNYANSAILVDVKTTDYGSEHPLAGIEFQRKYEKKAYELSGGTNQIPTARLGDYKESKLSRCIPEFAKESIIEAMPIFARKIKGFDLNKALFKGVETRSSSPVRFFRDKACQSNIKGIYPAGEGAGYAGGIMSAAVDGIRVAEIIAEGKIDG